MEKQIAVSVRRLSGKTLAEALHRLWEVDEVAHNELIQAYLRVATRRLLKKEIASVGNAFAAIHDRTQSTIQTDNGSKSWEARWRNWGPVAFISVNGTVHLPIEVNSVSAINRIPIFDSYMDAALQDADFEIRIEPTNFSHATVRRKKSTETQTITAIDSSLKDETVQVTTRKNEDGSYTVVDARKLTKWTAEPDMRPEKKPMSKVDKIFNDFKSATGNATKRQAGRTALAIIHTAVFEKLPFKWSWWAKITGRKQKIINSPYTKLVTAAAAHGLVVALKPDSKVTYVTRGALQFALDNAIDKGVDVELMVQKAMGVDKDLLEELVAKLSDESKSGKTE